MKVEKATAGIHGVRSNPSGPRKASSSYAKEKKPVAPILGCKKAVRLHQSYPTCNL